MKHNEFEGLYADDETYEDYMNRKLSESVQYKPKEDTTMSQYYNYDVEDEKTENNKSLSFTGEILAAASSLLFFGGLVGIILWIIVGGLK